MLKVAGWIISIEAARTWIERHETTLPSHVLWISAYWPVRHFLNMQQRLGTTPLLNPEHIELFTYPKVTFYLFLSLLRRLTKRRADHAREVWEI